jgi:hypothetical protein
MAKETLSLPDDDAALQEKAANLIDHYVDNELPACETVLDIIGNFFAQGRQLKHLVLDDRIVSLLGKLPILGCFIPEIVSPFHVVRSNEPGS